MEALKSIGEKLKAHDNGDASALSEEDIKAYLNFLQEQQNKDSEVVTPIPSFVVKTSLVSLDSGAPKISALPPTVSPGMKVFINITHHSLLSPIATRPAGDLETENGGSALSVPLAMGEPRMEKDHSGQDCLALDVIVNPSVTQDCEKDKTGGFRHWLVDFCIQYFTRKHGGVLSPHYRVPQLIYKGKDGKVVSQRLRRPKAAVIREETTSTGGDGSAKPLSLLAEAGALPESSTGLVPVRKVPVAAATAAANFYAAASPVSLPKGPPKGAPPVGGAAMDLRLVGEEGGRGSSAEDMSQSAAIPTLLKTALQGGGRGEDDIGLSATSTKRIVSSALPVIRVDIEYQSGEISHCTVALSSSQALQVGGKGSDGNGSKGDEVSLTCSSLSPLPEEAKVLRVEIEFNNSRGAPPPLSSQIKLKGDALGSILRFSCSTVGWSPFSLRLPFLCSFVRSGEDGEYATTVRAQYLTAECTLCLDLPPCLRAELPPLPSRISLPAAGEEEDTEMRELLSAYVEAGAVQDYAPDVGSRLWLLAQALSSEDRIGGKAGGREGGEASAQQQGPEDQQDILPEDRYIAADALSMHYVRMKEEEREKARQKEEERNREREAEEQASKAKKEASAILDASNLFTDLL